VPHYQSYIICTSPRSGSTLLCGLLAATGVSGNPGSHFHHPSLFDWLRYYGLSVSQFADDRDALVAIFDAARVHGTGDTGMFGLRLQRHSFSFFIQQLNILHPDLSNDTERIQAAFGNTFFIHLTRSNKIEQAISYVKATQTGLWHMASDGTELERLSAPQEPVYDASEIEKRLSELTALDRDWETWFSKEKLKPLRLTYDEISNDSTRSLVKILDMMGLDNKVAQHARPSVAKLADATSRAWAERFVAEVSAKSNPQS